MIAKTPGLPRNLLEPMHAHSMVFSISMQHFREAVGQETGLVMNPLACEKASPSHGAQLRVPTDGSGSNSSSLSRQTTLSALSRDCE